MKSIAFGHKAQAYKYLAASAALVLLLNVSAFAQKSSDDWYSFGVTERGQLSDLKDKRRVFVSLLIVTSDMTPAFDLQRAAIGQQLYQEFKRNSDLEVVKNIAEADFIIEVWISPLAGEAISGRPLAEQSADVKFTVYTRSEKASNGHYGRRVVTQKWNSARGDVPSVVRQETAAFVRDLKRVQGK
ncbi:MAG TPA: hypothetical protein VF717_14085 [Pyrinomonadaceae bacterium]|jgi:hypothetical protein